MSLDGPCVTICILTYGGYGHLVRRCLSSIAEHCDPAKYRLIVGANSPSRGLVRTLDEFKAVNGIDHLIVSDANLNKCPMMQRIFEHVTTPLVWWFDDDSYIAESGALDQWLAHVSDSPSNVVQWGQLKWCDSTIEFTHFNERATLDL